MTTFALFEFDKLFVDASFVLDTDVFCWEKCIDHTFVNYPIWKSRILHVGARQI